MSKEDDGGDGGDEGRERAKAAEARIKEFRAGGREVDSEVPDSCAGAAQEPMEDDAEDQMEKPKRPSGWEDLAERTKRPRKDDVDEDMLLEVACQDDFDEAGCAEEVAEEFNDDRSGKKLDPKNLRLSRDEELVELERRVYVEADVEECVKVTGKKPTQARWWTSTRASASTGAGSSQRISGRRTRSTTARDSTPRPRRWRS